MSYDISEWKTARLDKLAIPLLFIADNQIGKRPDGKTVVMLTEDGSELMGVLGEDGTLHVEDVALYGEGSRNALDVLEELLLQSTGVLDAVLIWEGGDSITRFRSIGGVVTNEEVDIVALILASDKEE